MMKATMVPATKSRSQSSHEEGGGKNAWKTGAPSISHSNPFCFQGIRKGKERLCYGVTHPRRGYIAVANADEDERGLRKEHTWRYDIFDNPQKKPIPKITGRFTLST
eukprot:644335-Pelagomonas_calceolata.AAC.1